MNLKLPPSFTASYDLIPLYLVIESLKHFQSFKLTDREIGHWENYDGKRPSEVGALTEEQIGS